MGIGDEIMASGHALSESLRLKRRVRILDRAGRERWHGMWEGLRYIVRPGERGDYPEVVNGPQCRPYIQYPFTKETGYKFTGWRARDHVGRIALTREEVQFAAQATHGLGQFLFIEPHISPKSNPNKDWGWDKWQELVHLLQGYKIVQTGAPGTRVLDGVTFIESSFRQAAAVLARSKAAILPEGGFHHAAGVFGKYAVVLFGGVIDPEITGYPWHYNMVDRSEGRACGRWTKCTHCQKVWDMLSAETVAAGFHRYLVETKQGVALNAKAS